MGKRIDMTGQRFGRLVVLEHVATEPRRGKWLCQCDCGNKKLISRNELMSGHVNSCGCLKMKEPMPIEIGDKCHYLTLIEKKTKYIGVFKCECGNEVELILNEVTNGHVHSCGCSRNYCKGIHREGRLGDFRPYRIYRGILNRCYVPTEPAYKYYGARGVKVCEEWRHNFDEFYKWAISNGYTDNLTIDRIDTDGNYEPSNCRWITQAEQSRNRRMCNKVTHNGKTQTVAEWERELGFRRGFISNRMRVQKLTFEEAINYPLYFKRKVSANG